MSSKKIDPVPVIFTILLVIHLFPIWSVENFHTQDGPVTVYNAHILYDLLTSKDTSFYDTFYHINESPSPNWLSGLLLTGLLFITKAATANKILLSLYIISFSWSFYYLINTIDPKKKLYAFYIFPMLYSYFLFFGFYNFLLSLSVFCWIIGYFISTQGVLRGKNLWILFFMVLLLYLSHVVSYVLAFTFLLILKITFESKGKLSVFPLKEFIIKQFRTTLPLLYIFLPTLLLFGFYLINSHRSIGLHSETPLDHFLYFIGLQSLVTFNNQELWLVIIFGLLLLLNILVNWKKSTFSLSHLLTKEWTLTLVIFSIIIFTIAPNQLGGGSILKYRIPLYCYLLIIMWITQANKSIALMKVGAVVTILLSLSLLAVRMPIINQMNEDIMTYLRSSEGINNYSTVLPLTLDRNGSMKDGQPLSPDLNIYKNIGSYLGHEKDVIILDNYQARTTYFPLIWNDEVNPFVHISQNRSPIYKDGNIEAYPPCADFADYSKRSGQNVDYVVIWGKKASFAENECQISSNAQLASSYKKVYSDNMKVETYMFLKDSRALMP